MPRIQARFRLQPSVKISARVAAEWPNFDPLLFLLAALLDLSCWDSSDAAMVRVVDVNVGARAWVWAFDFLVHWTHIA